MAQEYPPGGSVYFLLRYFEGNSVKQIANSQNMEANKVSKRLFSLRARLKENLEENGVML